MPEGPFFMPAYINLMHRAAAQFAAGVAPFLGGGFTICPVTKQEI